MRKAGEYLGVTLAILLMVAATLTYFAPHLGWRVDVLCSGSMEPQLSAGDLVVTRPVAPEAVLVGDIITFYPTAAHENLVTHRVIGIQEHSPLFFQTKGDANALPDPFDVPARNLVGKVGFHAPYLGYVTAFLKTPWGFLLALVIPGFILLTMYLRSIQQALRQDKERTLSKVVKV